MEGGVVLVSLLQQLEPCLLNTLCLGLPDIHVKTLAGIPTLFMVEGHHNTVYTFFIFGLAIRNLNHNFSRDKIKAIELSQFELTCILIWEFCKLNGKQLQFKIRESIHYDFMLNVSHYTLC